jgi:hypothetical protein
MLVKIHPKDKHALKAALDENAEEKRMVGG